MTLGERLHLEASAERCAGPATLFFVENFQFCTKPLDVENKVLPFSVGDRNGALALIGIPAARDRVEPAGRSRPIARKLVLGEDDQARVDPRP